MAITANGIRGKSMKTLKSREKKIYTTTARYVYTIMVGKPLRIGEKQKGKNTVEGEWIIAYMGKQKTVEWKGCTEKSFFFSWFYDRIFRKRDVVI